MELLKTCLLVLSLGALEKTIAGEYQGQELVPHDSFSSTELGPYEEPTIDETKEIILEQIRQSGVPEAIASFHTAVAALTESSQPCVALENFFRLIQNENNTRLAEIRKHNGFRDTVIRHLDHCNSLLLQKLIDEKTLSENDLQQCEALKIICQHYLALSSEIEQILNNPARTCTAKYSRDQRVTIRQYLLKIWRLGHRGVTTFELNC